MLAEAAFRLGLRPRVLASSSQDPAAQLCPDSVYGPLGDVNTLRRFLSQVPIAIFESEFVSIDLLRQASEGLGVRFLPGLDAIYLLQDKVRQKKILAHLDIPTAPFEVLATDSGAESASATDARKWAQQMLGKFEGGAVFKWAQQGYDGRGTCIFPGASTTAVTAFCETAAKAGIPLYVEQKVLFRRELAVVACYSVAGEFTAYPLVVSKQKNGICKLVTGPATAAGVSPALEKRAQDYARRLAAELSLYGCFAIEFFETQNGDLWVNELAPRVHNTGHYTQDAAETSQFENHWRAVLGLPLGGVLSAPGFAMLNLLGPENLKPGYGHHVPLPEFPSSVHLHWYGKQELRPGRKLGHLNGRISSSGDIPKLVEELERAESAWAKSLEKK
jgi:5-(carboxyamino)imidazole ribonucleotide synthase